MTLIATTAANQNAVVANQNQGLFIAKSDSEFASIIGCTDISSKEFRDRKIVLTAVATLTLIDKYYADQYTENLSLVLRRIYLEIPGITSRKPWNSHPLRSRCKKENRISLSHTRDKLGISADHKVDEKKFKSRIARDFPGLSARGIDVLYDATVLQLENPSLVGYAGTLTLQQLREVWTLLGYLEPEGSDGPPLYDFDMDEVHRNLAKPDDLKYVDSRTGKQYTFLERSPFRQSQAATVTTGKNTTTPPAEKQEIPLQQQILNKLRKLACRNTKRSRTAPEITIRQRNISKTLFGNLAKACSFLATGECLHEQTVAQKMRLQFEFSQLAAILVCENGRFPQSGLIKVNHAVPILDGNNLVKPSQADCAYPLLSLQTDNLLSEILKSLNTQDLYNSDTYACDTLRIGFSVGGNNSPSSSHYCAAAIDAARCVYDSIKGPLRAAVNGKPYEGPPELNLFSGTWRDGERKVYRNSGISVTIDSISDRMRAAMYFLPHDTTFEQFERIISRLAPPGELDQTSLKTMFSAVRTSMGLQADLPKQADTTLNVDSIDQAKWIGSLHSNFTVRATSEFTETIPDLEGQFISALMLLREDPHYITPRDVSNVIYVGRRHRGIDRKVRKQYARELRAEKQRQLKLKRSTKVQQTFDNFVEDQDGSSIAVDVQSEPKAQSAPEPKAAAKPAATNRLKKETNGQVTTYTFASDHLTSPRPGVPAKPIERNGRPHSAELTEAERSWVMAGLKEFGSLTKMIEIIQSAR